jgi:DNA-binding NarL/FixJ family response regulator
MTTWTEPKFDKHAFGGRKTKAVSATKTPEGWDSPGISFGDLSTMHIQKREKVKERRLPRPAWAGDNEIIQSVVLNAAERRLYLPHDGPNDQRRARITAEAERRLPSMRAKLDRALLRHHEAAQSGASPERLQRLAIQVGGADTEIIMLERGLVGMLVAVLYMYYNLGYNSVQVAEELGIKSPAVRMILYTLHRAHARLLQGSARGNRAVDADSKYISEWPVEKVRLMFLLRTNGKSWKQMGQILKACPNSVMNHWRKYFGDLNLHKVEEGPRLRRYRLSKEEYQARLAVRRQEREAKRQERRAEREAKRRERIEVAEKLGISTSALQYRMRGVEIERQPRVIVPKEPRIHARTLQRSRRDERVAKFIELRKSGLTQREAADKMGITYNQARRLEFWSPVKVPQIHRHGGRKGQPGRKGLRARTIDEMKTILALREEGLTRKEIAAKTGLTFHVVAHRWRELKMSKPAPKRAEVYYVKRAGYDAKNVNHGETSWTPDKLKKLAELWNAGESVGQCAKTLGAPAHGVRYAVHRILKRQK